MAKTTKLETAVANARTALERASTEAADAARELADAKSRYASSPSAAAADAITRAKVAVEHCAEQLAARRVESEGAEEALARVRAEEEARTAEEARSARIAELTEASSIAAFKGRALPIALRVATAEREVKKAFAELVAVHEESRAASSALRALGVPTEDLGNHHVLGTIALVSGAAVQGSFQTEALALLSSRGEWAYFLDSPAGRSRYLEVPSHVSADGAQALREELAFVLEVRPSEGLADVIEEVRVARAACDCKASTAVRAGKLWCAQCGKQVPSAFATAALREDDPRVHALRDAGGLALARAQAGVAEALAAPPQVAEVAARGVAAERSFFETVRGVFSRVFSREAKPANEARGSEPVTTAAAPAALEDIA